MIGNMKSIFILYIVALLSISSNAIVPQIKKVIVLMMENRGFDHTLGYLKQINPDIDGCLPNADGCSNPTDPLDESSTTYTVDDNAVYLIHQDPSHSTREVTRQIYGTLNGDLAENATTLMNGFIKSYATVYQNETLGPSIMSCYSMDHAPVLANLSLEFALFDGWFSSVPGCTYPNRAYAMAGSSYGMATNDPVTTAKGLPNKTVFRQLLEMGLDYHVYFSDVPSTLLFKDMRHHDARQRYSAFEKFYEDVANGTLPDFTWLEPSFFDTPWKAASDQHPGHDFAVGEILLKNVYEAVRNSPIWNEVAFIITYDEHGGFFDHVPPQPAPSPDGINSTDDPFDFTRIGVRVPTLLISPWVKKGTVLHKAGDGEPQYEHTSILATVVHKIFKNKVPFPAPEYLNARDAFVRTFESAFTTRSSGPRDDCVKALPTPIPHRELFPNTLPPLDGKNSLSDLQKDLIILVRGAASEGQVTSLPDDIDSWTEVDGWKYCHDVLDKYFDV